MLRLPRVLAAALLTVSDRAPAADLSRARSFTLDNGLEVLALRDPSHPVVAVQALYRVGARNEVPGITGIAHFLEHMLFRGTAGFGPKDVTGVIERAGGEWHGYTYLDCTTYFEAAPRDLLPTLLRLEAERMTRGRLAAGEVDAERGAVFQEYRGYQIDARSDLYDEAIAVLFQQHPYRNNTMGYESDLQAIDHADLAAFYRRFYGPRNAVLSIAGDFDERTLEAEVRAAFGSIPAGGESTLVRTVEPPLTGQRRFTIRRPGASPALMVSFLAPPPARPRDYAALMILDAVLGSAKGLSFRVHSGDLTEGREADPSSRLGRLRASSPARRFGTALVPTLYPYHYTIYASPAAGRDPEEIVAPIFASLEGVAAGVSADEIDSARRRIESALLLEIDSPVGIAHELAFWAGLGGLRIRQAIIDALAQVSPEDVRRIARDFAPDAAVVAVLLPTGPVAPHAGDRDASPGALAADSGAARFAPPPHSTTSPPRLTETRPAPARTATIETLTLGDGARAIVDARPGLEVFVLKVAVAPGGPVRGDSRAVRRLRSAAVFLEERTDDLARLADLGVRLTIPGPGQTVFAERDTLQIMLRGPAARLAGAAGILAEPLRDAVALQLETKPGPPGPPADVALRRLSDALDGSSPSPDAGRPGIAIALVSPYSPSSVKGLLKSLAASGAAPAEAAAGPFPAGRRVETMPDIPQGRLLFAIPGLGDPEALKALAYVLHHSYGGRLGAKAIAGMGLVYEMDSEAVTRGRPLAYFTMGADPRSLADLEKALAEILDSTAATLTEEEVAEYRMYAAGDLAVRLSDPSKAAALHLSVLLRGEDHTGPRRAVERARALTLAHVRSLADTALDPRNRFVVLVTRK